MLEPLLERFRRHDRLALSRLLSLVSRGESVESILQGAGPQAGPSRVVAITGSPGVGKSTLIGRLIELLRARGQTVAVLACDPESPVTGGALLGDRYRMGGQPEDQGIFIRSLPAPPGQEAIAEHLQEMVELLARFGFDVIVIETAGAGQGDTRIRALADVLVLLIQPEAGDELQWEKAGLLEVADIVVVQKADLPEAMHVETQVRAILGLSHKPPVPVIRASARTGAGIEDLWQAIAAIAAPRKERARTARELLDRVQALVAARFARAQADARSDLSAILADWKQGSSSDAGAAAAALRTLQDRPAGSES